MLDLVEDTECRHGVVLLIIQNPHKRDMNVEKNG